ncbi:hypothetical protein [Bacillus testis]|uniref:hypothetical protein n=1 Tax=Bacillus testis TaxID=1622072 RepID=UPI00067F34FA|nr:hypothetical protein [Bacillus testis]
MKKRGILILYLLLVMTLSADSSITYNLYKKLNILEQSTLQTIEKHYQKNLFSNPRVSINKKTIYVNLDLDPKILNMEAVDQFKVFKMFARKFRFILYHHSSRYGDDLSKKNLIISGQSDNNVFEYNSTLPYKNSIYSYDSHLSLNKKTVFSSTEFKRTINQSTVNSYIEKVNGYDDLDIHRYARNLFNVMTKNGKYYNPSKDDQLFLEAICDKFNISPEEYAKIENKYYLIPSLPY